MIDGGCRALVALCWTRKRKMTLRFTMIMLSYLRGIKAQVPHLTLEQLRPSFLKKPMKLKKRLDKRRRAKTTMERTTMMQKRKLAGSQKRGGTRLGPNAMLVEKWK
jgi:hypothetical protein